MSFSGTFDYTLDAKNRLTVPARMRASLTGSVILSRGTDRCLAIWPKDDFEAFVADALEGTGALDRKRDRLKRHFFSHSFEAELDSAGRVMISPKHMEYAGLAKEVVVNGVGDRIEVWDREAWNRYNEDEDITDLTALFSDTPA